MPLNRLFSLFVAHSLHIRYIHCCVFLSHAWINYSYSRAHIWRNCSVIFFRVEIFFSVVALYCHYCCCRLVCVSYVWWSNSHTHTHRKQQWWKYAIKFFFSLPVDTILPANEAKTKKMKKFARVRFRIAFRMPSVYGDDDIFDVRKKKNKPNIMIIIYEWIEKICRPGRPVDLFAFGAGQFVKNSNSSCQCQWMISVLRECVRDHSTLRMLLVYFGNSFTYDVVRTSAFIRTVRMVKWFHVLYGGWWWWWL